MGSRQEASTRLGAVGVGWSGGLGVGWGVRLGLFGERFGSVGGTAVGCGMRKRFYRASVHLKPTQTSTARVLIRVICLVQARHPEPSPQSLGRTCPC